MTTREFQVMRFDPETDSEPGFQSFSVEDKPGMTVLEGLFQIQQKLDGSLAFRSSCRAGICGSCAMHINGSYRLACETQVGRLGGAVRVRPLGHMKVLKDLVVDMAPFWAKYKQIKPYLMPGNPNPAKERIQTTDDREKLTEVIDCILCGCCYGACTVTLTDPDYLGPAALLKANRFLQDSRDNSRQERLKLVDGDHGVWRCHTIFNCQKVCPKSIDVTGSIANLKRKSILNKFTAK
jgi:succinate dehydrogenase / fumarate reductase iron-sulfur subunit